MRSAGVSIRYAQALLASARQESVDLSSLEESYAAVCQVMEQNAGLPSFLEGPQVAEDEKKQLLTSLLADRVEPLLVRFFHLLIDKNRIEYLEEIGGNFKTLVEKAQGLTRAVVTTAITLPADLEAALTGRLTKMTGGAVILEKHVDPTVIGGVSVTFGDQIIDGTVRTNLDLLRQRLSKVSVR